MPILNRDDAVEVEERISRVFAASPAQRPAAVRRLFVEVLDFNAASGQVSLAGAAGPVHLPAAAERVAELDGVHVLFVALPDSATDRIRKAEVDAAARCLADQLGDDLLLVCINPPATQLHLILPDFTGARPTLRRLVLEQGLPCRTAIEQVSNIYWNYQASRSIGATLERAFDVEPVTRKFFAEYQRIFKAAEQSITGFPDNDDGREIRRSFVQTLFNRLMFVYFLSRKDWLTFNGKTDYLNALWRDYSAQPAHGDFYTTRLRPLFFSGLNNPDSRDLTEGLATLIGDVPFLNGGLFEQTELDRRNDITVPDAAIGQVLSGLFDHFNFTVTESTPFDIEVAVDPEMLGKVFEELVTGRHDSGAYYTPRPVVAFMCREALKGYLEGQDAGRDTGLETGLDAEAIARFVERRDSEGLSVTAARRISEALNRVKVVDPACGSGAYLLGMMQELIELQTTLYNAGVDDKSLYQLKLEIIQRNLYGVDLDSFAVNIARLRLWLSLAIDYEGETPPPLPNLDFKVVCGDSLLGPNPSPENYGDLSHDLARRLDLGGLKARYMNATDGKEKQRLKGEIASVEEQVKTALGDAAVPEGVVDYRVRFAEVFAERRGFDIAIANPPYVVVKDSQLRAMYAEGIYGRMNTYGLFIQRSLQLLTDGAQQFFINPRTLLTDRYFTNLRKVIRQKSELKGVVLIADRHNTFERVLQECIILHLAKRTEPAKSYRVNTRAISIPADLNAPRDVVSVDSERVLLNEAYDGAFYIGASEVEYRVFERMNSAGVKLSDYGLKAETGKIQFDKYREYAQPTSDNDACRLVWAENVQRYVRRASSKRTGKEWLENGITALVPPNIVGAGIVTQRTSANEQPRRIIATLIAPQTVESNAIYSENGTNFISLGGDAAKYKFLVGILNSSLMEFVFRRLNSNVHVSAGEINSLPFPPIPDESTRGEIEMLVLALMELRGVDCQPDVVAQAMTYEHRLDILIGSLYGFSPGEVEQVQESLPTYEAVYGLPPPYDMA